MKASKLCRSFILISICALLLNPVPQVQAETKKGCAGQTGNAYQVGAVWAYNWGSGMITLNGGVEFVPMWWSYYGASQAGDTAAAANLKAAGANSLLAYNEPDHTDQANLSVSYALQGYTQASVACTAAGLSLISPACADDQDSWMTSFMAGVSSAGLKCDGVAVHCYLSSSSSFLSYVDAVYSKYGKPLWITEFAPTDWANPTTITVRQVCDFINTVIPALESRSSVTRFSWYCGTMPGNGTLGTAALFYSDNSLTPAGACYKNPNAVSSPLANGTYSFINQNSGLAMEVYNSLTANGSSIDQWAYNGGNNQLWTLTQLGNGVYEIIGTQSGRSLDVTSQSMASGASLEIWDYWGGDNQKWFIAATANGYYKVISMGGGCAVTVASASTADGATVDMETYTGASSQQWLIQDPKPSVPAAPTGLKATAGTKQIALSWTASSGAKTYNVYRGTASGKESRTPIATGITSTNYTNTGLTTGTTYYYEVAAVNANGAKGTSALSKEVSATAK